MQPAPQNTLSRVLTLHPLELYLVCTPTEFDIHSTLCISEYVHCIPGKRVRRLHKTWRNDIITHADEWEMEVMEGQVKMYNTLYGNVLNNWLVVKLGFAVGIQLKVWEN